MACKWTPSVSIRSQWLFALPWPINLSPLTKAPEEPHYVECERGDRNQRSVGNVLQPRDEGKQGGRTATPPLWEIVGGDDFSLSERTTAASLMLAALRSYSGPGRRVNCSHGPGTGLCRSKARPARGMRVLPPRIHIPLPDPTPHSTATSHFHPYCPFLSPLPPPLPYPLRTPCPTRPPGATPPPPRGPHPSPHTMFQMAVRHSVCSLSRSWLSWRLTKIGYLVSSVHKGRRRGDKNLRLFVCPPRTRAG